MKARKFIPISKPYLDEKELKLITKVLRSGNLTSAAFSGGKMVQEFERLLAKFTGAREAVAVSSGTAALHAALMALDLNAEDEVIIPSMTFVATANAVVAAGAKPVFADIKSDYTIDAEDIERKITPKTKAIIPVHLYGHTADMDRIMEIAEKHSLHVIEDACQSLGSIYRKRQSGTIAEMGCYSFYPSKVLTSGEGGAVVTNSKELAEKLRMIRNHGMVEGYDTRILGLNMRMPEINAAIATIQMRKLPRMLRVRKRNAKILEEKLSKINVIIPEEPDDSSYNWYLYTIAINDRDRVAKELNELGIGATIYYRTPVHRTPFYSSRIQLPKTEWAADHVLSLPTHPFVSREDASYIAKSLEKILK